MPSKSSFAETARKKSRGNVQQSHGPGLTGERNRLSGEVETI